jgi:hypothetical protein
MESSSSASNLRRVLILIVLAASAYLPALKLPFIADDYVLIPVSRSFMADGLTSLWYNPSLRSRVTAIVLNAGLDRLFGFQPLPFYAASILFHTLCVLLIYACCCWGKLSPTIAFWAACFFAIQEGHQEAVMWLAAVGDLLILLFGLASWVCWVKWLERGEWKWYAGALLSLILALVSKETAWYFPVLMLFPLFMGRKPSRREVGSLLPFFLIVAAYVAFTVYSHLLAPGYSDNRFSLSAPWPLIMANSLFRMLFVWGMAALAVIAYYKERTDWRIAAAGLVGMVIGIGPYSFLTYMMQVPSRHTYVGSVGLAMIVGTAANRLLQANRRGLLAVLAVVTLSVNLEILWVKKYAQYMERAEPTELLKQALADANGTIEVECTPLPEVAVKYAIEDYGGKAIFLHPGEDSNPSCFLISYEDRTGKRVRVNKKMGTQKHGAFY